MSSEHLYTGTTRPHASIPRTTQAGQSSASDLVSVLGLDALGHQNTDTQVGCAGTVPGGHFAETAVIPGDFADHHFGTRDMSNAPSRTSLPDHITDHRPTPLHRPNNRPACSKRGGLVPAASMRGASGNLRCHCHHQIGRIILGWLECRSPSESPTPMTTCILCSSTAAHLSQSTRGPFHMPIHVTWAPLGPRGGPVGCRRGRSARLRRRLGARPVACMPNENNLDSRLRWRLETLVSPTDYRHQNNRSRV